jgi:hypothetical protein
VQKLKPSFKKSQRDPWLQALLRDNGLPDDPCRISFAEFVVGHPEATRTLQQKLGIGLLVARKNKGKNSNTLTKLLYDGRHAVLDAAKEDSAPLRCLLLDTKNRLLGDPCFPASLPRLARHSHMHAIYATAGTPLWQLLGARSPPEAPDARPQNLSELRDYVDRCQLCPHTKVVVRYASGSQVKSPLYDWFESGPAVKPVKRAVFLRAFANVDYSIAYALDSDAGLKKATKRGQQAVRDSERYRGMWLECEASEKDDESEAAPDPFQANCSAAVSVSHTGLNLAFNLGLVSKEELSRLSEQLGATFSSLYVFLDEKDHLRHVTYFDALGSFFREVPCFENNGADEDRDQGKQRNGRLREKATQIMTVFWQDVWKRREHWLEKRRELLLPLTQQLEAILLALKPVSGPVAKKLVSPYSRCLGELRKVIHHHRVLLCSKQDAALHSIKFFLAHFAYGTFKRCRGVSLKAQSNNALVRLSVPGMTVVNAHAYFFCQSDADFYAGLWTPWVGPKPSDVVVSHSRKDLQNQQPVQLGSEGTATVRSYCKQRGFLFARTVHRRWVAFGRFLLEAFGYEIHGQISPPSASYLAFQCVWTRYARTAGPLVQAPERCKPYHEDLLRERSRGGFMFSGETAIGQGEPLFPHTDPHCHSAAARSLVEYDLISAYGYAAAKSRIPSGFCTGFERTTPPSSVPQDVSSLERLDVRARHKSFEFRAVFKAIESFVRRSNVPARSLYHNYSPLGIFTLGMYNLDLAIVTETGQILLVNMDGMFAHSCDTCPSPPPPSKRQRFVNGQTREEVRAKSEQRDADIRAWVDSINAGFAALGRGPETVSYAVIHDCHTPGYTTRELEQSFATNPELRELVRGYRVTVECGSSLSLRQFRELVSSRRENDDSFTFIAKAEVSIVPPPWLAGNNEANDRDGCLSLGPLIVYCNKDKDEKDDLSVGDAFRPGRPKSNRYARQALAWRGTVVLTRDYYRWLELTYGDRFSVGRLDWVLFYKTEPAVNAIYRELIDLRSTTPDPVLVTFIKRIVNLSAGFFGVRSSQRNKTLYRLVNKMPANFSFLRHTWDTKNHVLLGDASYHLFETSPLPKPVHKRQPAKSAVALFLAIVEYGKLRLVEIFHFFREHLSPGHCKLYYCNVDNAIVGLSADSLDQTVAPERWASYRAQKSSFIYEESENETTGRDREAAEAPKTRTAGLAELEWKRFGPDCDWKFITLRIQHYCLKVPAQPHQDLHKTSGWSDVSNEQAFDWAQELFRGAKVDVIQKRRVSKMFCTETRRVVFQY